MVQEVARLCAIARQRPDWLEPGLQAVLTDMEERARIALSSPDERGLSDFINVHGAAVAALERRVAAAWQVRIECAQSVIAEVRAACGQLGWSDDHLARTARALREGDRHPPQAIKPTGRSLALRDERDVFAHLTVTPDRANDHLQS